VRLQRVSGLLRSKRPVDPAPVCQDRERLQEDLGHEYARELPCQSCLHDGPALGVVRGVGVERVNQDVGIEEDHRARSYRSARFHSRTAPR
jgi:hypothetical protein